MLGAEENAGFIDLKETVCTGKSIIITLQATRRIQCIIYR